ncbi:MAG: AAA family ATPase, partial [Acidimicrobiales bacterium]
MPGRARRKRRKAKGRLGLWTGIAVAVLLAAYAFVILSSQPHVGGDRLSLTTFLDLTQEKRIQEATILDVDSFVVGTYLRTDGTTEEYSTPFLKETRQFLVDTLVAEHIPTTIDQQNGKRSIELASLLLPALIITIVFVYLIVSFRQGTGLFGIRSGARRHREDATPVTFADVAGQDGAVEELSEITAFLKDPERFTALGAAAPKGVLLYGPPGCGKTLLARAVAGESHASFFSISGSDFVELYVGVGAARVRDLFAEARDNAPAIVFVDELDAVGRARAAGGSASIGQGEQEQALNQLLTELDGFSPSDGIIVLGATNRPDVLDPALLRPGRFDRSVGLERPGESARLAILTLHAGTKPIEAGADLGALARRAIGLTGADLASVLNEAAFLAARASRTTITLGDLDEALQRILAAPERQRRLAMRDRSVGRRFASEERVTFADVAGAGDAVDELAEVREYLAEPDRYTGLGARVPRGILLSGPPGCGKTLLARAVAGETNAAFFSVAASEFVTMYTGAGAGRLRDLFAEARSMAPAIVFIDEIDSLGGRRSDGPSDSERDQTLNQLLVELDGFEPSGSLIVMAATNRPDLLDPALVRPGRFDRHVTVTLPDRAGRLAILELHARTARLAPGTDLAAVAGHTAGFSGADLANVVNEAALLATRRSSSSIETLDFSEAVER